ncbi:ISL3 family transposase [Agrobacterium vitis]
MKGLISFDLLRLDGYMAMEVEELEGRLYVDTQALKPEKPRCACDAPDVVKHGKRVVHFRDFPIQRQETYLRITRQRYRCRSCASILLERLPFIDDDKRMTARFRDQLFKDGIEMKFRLGGDINGVKESLVRRTFKEEARKRFQTYTFDLPRILGMDEKVIGGSPRFVIGDVENRLLLDITESRKKEDLVPYFKQWSHADRMKVEVITQDMYWGYKTLNEQYFKASTIVIDRFHVVRYADWAVSKVRQKIQEGAINEDRIELKDKMELFQTRPQKLKDEEKAEMERLFKKHPKIEEAYTLKEWFYKIYHCKTREEAENDYEAWRRLIPDDMKGPFSKIFSFMRESRWRRYIFNYFDHRYTNGYIEGLNGLLDEINRGGRGYDLETLRYKALLKYGDVKRLIDIYTYDLWKISPEEREEILGTSIGHGINLSTFERDLRADAFW